MAIKIVNNLGVISIENDIIVDLAAITVCDCYGISGLASSESGKKGAEILGRDDFSKGISIKIVDNTLNIDAHVIVNYGANIQSVGDSAIEAVKAKVAEITGVRVGEVGIFVEGVAME